MDTVQYLILSLFLTFWLAGFPDTMCTCMKKEYRKLLFTKGSKYQSFKNVLSLVLINFFTWPISIHIIKRIAEKEDLS